MAGRRGNGEGSISKRPDGKWQGQITVGRDPDSGKLKRTSVYGATRKEVLDKIEEIRGRVKTNTYSAPTKQTMGEWMRNWLNDYMVNTLRPTTFESYRIHIEKHIIPEIGYILLNKLQTGNLQRLYNDKIRDGRIRKVSKKDQEGNPLRDTTGSIIYENPGLSPRTVRYIHMIIHSALEQAVRELKITINPANAVKLPASSRKEMQAFDQDEIQQFLKAAKDSEYYTAFLFELFTGLRRGELLGLTWDNVDLKKCEVKVMQQLVRVKNNNPAKATKTALEIRAPKTKLSNRTVVFPSDLVDALRQHKAEQTQTRWKLKNLYHENNLVFSTIDGNPIDPKNLARGFKLVLKKAGMRELRFHDLRHTFAVMSLQQGVSIKALQEDLGHHSAAFTLDTYGHVTAEMRTDAANKRGKILKLVQEGV